MSPINNHTVKMHNSCTIQHKLDTLNFAIQYGDVSAAFSRSTTPKSIKDWRKQESKLKEMLGDKQGKRKRLRGGG